MIKFIRYFLRRYYFTILDILKLFLFSNMYLQSTVKRQIISSLIHNYKLKIFIESGTYLGDTAIYVSKFVNKVITVEVDNFLFNRAKKRIKKRRNIIVIEGDSGREFLKILPELTDSSLFFLDGHYSGGISGMTSKYLCPLEEELSIIEKFKYLNSSIVVIDDARELGVTEGYPSIVQIEEIFRQHTYIKIEICDMLILIFD